ncbi:thiophen and furan oxidation protein [Synechocystis sp. PCC 6803]|jgi:tRNA modification GTPase|uniref:tRNA modification GTPase MnmE n=1 Tax=Synechocystis sp. (strain ATCC 27184 / PCC 6803 / Kazusa) TaxID=1111708 RepID=MNME_SYNY3|nr:MULTISPECIES: tRNA uridine-5-carboxymethylaminomethyl(34) synthesis GTPase MnmE [unclassified Synechocystis]P73839.1 RecName: Full=tRNA modification GTPase MnmE [Synechocystis sp. PCC 6803 substr. Kazusa]BAM51650.1 tRNA modification GTPase TrmE [Synechocystis sp. PCC 6803] [Bacillus subtilis BEST7613]AGF51584.1 thiophen and furan oxidation protein [Synechocystis sp. PCC 6803]ALJ67579.1 tRNA modification GTPase TrmE [Synechocystis sp. PCC 6803]AVP89423.1 tRNA uridine-5-carboxymethylaminometh
MQLEDTIAAIATAIVPQQGSIGVVRLSGPQSLTIAKTLFDAPGNQTWESHRILYGHVRHPQTKAAIDEALLLLMLAPRSYTKEDVVEFQCHGGIMPVQQVLQLCLQQGARLAQPGEFSFRAFLNGRLDLTQAESISELVGAQSPQAAAIALAGLQGKLAQPIRDLRNTCLDILAEVEARIDFEDDLPPLDEDSIRQQLQNLYQQLEDILNTAQRGELLRTGLKVAIVGQPNVGKSSLLNAWSRTDRAIVTDLPGTTRDVVESQLVVEGIPIQVLDTAGIRETADQVEQIGVERSRKAAQQADLVLLTVDAHQGWTEADQLIYEQVKDRPLILVINKIDLGRADLVSYPPEITNTVLTAAAANLGIEALENAIIEQVNQTNLSPQNLDFAINQRQEAVLTEAQLALKQLQQTMAEQLPLDFWTIDLRLAINALGQVTGETVTESVLDRIFSRFCIGK